MVNARGAISRRGEPVIEHVQRLMLEEEGVELGPGGRIDLDRFGWEPFGARMTRRLDRRFSWGIIPSCSIPR